MLNTDQQWDRDKRLVVEPRVGLNLTVIDLWSPIRAFAQITAVCLVLFMISRVTQGFDAVMSL